MTPERLEQKRLERLAKKAKKDKGWSEIVLPALDNSNTPPSLADSKKIWDEVEGMKSEPIEKRVDRLSNACYTMRDDIVMYLRETNDLLKVLINQNKRNSK